MNTVYQCRRLIVLDGITMTDAYTRPMRIWYWEAEPYLNQLGQLGWQIVSLRERSRDGLKRDIVVWVQCAITATAPDAAATAPPLPDQRPQRTSPP